MLYVWAAHVSKRLFKRLLLRKYAVIDMDERRAVLI
jgi:hypothetical protein